MIRTLNKLEIEGNFLNRIKGIYEKPTANITLKSERQCFTSKIKNKARMSALITTIQHFTGGSRQCNKARKRKAIWIRKKKVKLPLICRHDPYRENPKESTKATRTGKHV